MARTQLMGLIAILVLGAFLTGCDPESNMPSPGSPSSKQPQQIPSSFWHGSGETLLDQAKQFIPLAEGNTWIYERNLIDPENVYAFVESRVLEPTWEYPAGLTQIHVGRPLMSTIEGNKISLETYAVGKPNEDGHYAVTVTGEDLRDGRYLLGTRNFQELQSVNSHLRWLGQSLMEYWEIDVDGGRIEYSTMSANVKPGTSISHPSPQLEWEITSLSIDEIIQVPAGAIRCQLKNIRTYGAETGSGKRIFDAGLPEFSGEENGFGQFYTVMYFAKGIGLVKEIQYDYQSNPTYELSLKSFKVAQR